MGMFQDMLQHFTNGFVSAAVDTLRNGHASSGPNVIERLCQELGWPVDERDGNTVLLHFNDPLVQIRKVAISTGEKLMGFTVLSAVNMNPRQVSTEIMGYLLVRNSTLGGSAWQMFEAGNGNAGFSVTACMLIEGMNSAMFKFLCETMVKEAHEFDAKMKAGGLL